MTAATWAARVAADLRDLLLPGGCAGCGAAGPLRWHTCRDCAARCAGVPREVRPRPAPPGLPPVTAATAYDGAVRELLLAYKERGAHRLAVPLGGLLAGAVRLAAPGPAPVVVVPVPSTAAAARQRYGDHVARLARQAVRRLRSAGVPATVVTPLRMCRRRDSVGLDAARRRAAAAAAVTVRRRLSAWALPAGVRVVLVDDIVTTGATLAACAAALAASGTPARAAAVVAATPRRR